MCQQALQYLAYRMTLIHSLISQQVFLVLIRALICVSSGLLVGKI